MIESIEIPKMFWQEPILPRNLDFSRTVSYLQQGGRVAAKFEPKDSIWNKTVHASFRKVVAFDLFFYTLGVITGAGIIGIILLP